MKNLIPITLAATLVASGISSAQTPAYSKPSGYVTQQLQPGFNLVGLTLQTAPAFSGQVSGVSGSTITLSSAVSSVLPSGKTFILEVSSGVASGIVQEFTQFSGSAITLPTSIAGLANNDLVVIRIAPTLEEVFGTLLQSQATAGGSDIVWIPSGSGAYDRYYRKTPLFGAASWKKVGNPELDAPNTPLVYLDGMFVEVKSSAKTLTVAGTVKVTPSKFSISTGFNLVGTTFPVGSTLSSSGLQSVLQTQATLGGSDVVWISTQPGSFTKYFYKTPLFGTPTWVSVVNNVQTDIQGSTITVPGSVFIERKGVTKVVTITPPVSYNSL